MESDLDMEWINLYDENLKKNPPSLPLKDTFYVKIKNRPYKVKKELDSVSTFRKEYIKLISHFYDSDSDCTR